MARRQRAQRDAQLLNLIAIGTAASVSKPGHEAYQRLLNDLNQSAQDHGHH